MQLFVDEYGSLSICNCVRIQCRVTSNWRPSWWKSCQQASKIEEESSSSNEMKRDDKEGERERDWLERKGMVLFSVCVCVVAETAKGLYEGCLYSEAAHNNSGWGRAAKWVKSGLELRPRVKLMDSTNGSR